jgi:hypothetical protein
MLVSAPWIEHFRQFEVDEFRPLLDPIDPVEHYCQIRDCLAGGALRSLSAPIGRNFPPTVVLRSLVSKKDLVPLILEWPQGILPSVAIQCQLALLLAMAGEKRRSCWADFGRFGRWKKNTTKKRLACLAPSFCRPSDA